ncbi:MAG: aminotransferase class V-fold PLP-dependent enzyme [Ferrimicrobium sp.]
MANTDQPTLTHPIDVDRLRQDFPIFQEAQSGRPFVFLDSAASSQRPQMVLDAMDTYYHKYHANVHRGVYQLAEEATARYEAARRRLGEFIGAPEPEREIVFTKNATEAFNLIAQGLGRLLLANNGILLLTEMEHHANLVPWMILQEQLGFTIRYIPFDEHGYLILDNLDELLEGVSIVGVTMMSNVLGTINPITTIARAAHAHGALIVADGAQYVPHFPVDVQAAEIDLLCMSAHKMLGPTGIGALWARASILEKMTPFLGGGEMIADVRLDGFTPTTIPHKFEAGTPPIAEAIGWHAALDYLDQVGRSTIVAHEHAITDYALNALADGLGSRITIHGPTNRADRGGVISFDLHDVHPHDVAQVLDQHGVCVRAGHHCAKPLLREIGLSATTRASTYLYNDNRDIDALVSALDAAYRLFH